MKMKNTVIRFALVAVAVLLMGPPAFTQRVIRTVTLVHKDQVPAAVLTAFKSAYPKAKVRHLFMVDEEGRLSYEVESTDGATHRDVQFNADGSIAKITEGVGATDLPAAVQQTIREKYANAVVTSREKVTQSDTVTYKVSVKQRKESFDLEFDAGGKLIKARTSATNKIVIN